MNKLEVHFIVLHSTAFYPVQPPAKSCSDLIFNQDSCFVGWHWGLVSVGSHQHAVRHRSLIIFLQLQYGGTSLPFYHSCHHDMNALCWTNMFACYLLITESLLVAVGGRHILEELCCIHLLSPSLSR